MPAKQPFYIFGLAAALLILALLGPINPFERGWGGATDDFFEHLNLLAWQAHSAAKGAPFPLHSMDLAFPDGGCMYLPDPIGGTAMIPFVWVFGPVFAHNLLVFGNLWLAAMMVFAICMRRTRDPASSALAAFAYAACPVLLGNVNNGIDETMQALWLPWVVDRALALCETARRRDAGPGGLARSAALLALALGINTLAQWYYGFYGFMAAGAVVAAGLLVTEGSRRLQLGVAGMAAALGAGILIVGPATLFSRCFSSGESLFYLGSMDFYITQPKILIAHSVDPANFFSPREGMEGYRHLGYLGLVMPFLMLMAARRRLRLGGGLAALALIFLVFSLGPLLGWRGEVVETSAGAIRLPYYFFYKFLPFFKEMRLPYRFFLAFSACASLSIGLGLAGVFEGRKWRGALFLFAGAVLLGEIVFRSGAPVPMPAQDLRCSAPARELAGEGAVLDLPIFFGPAGRGRYLVDQCCHHRPIVYGVQGKDFSPALRANPFVNLLYLASSTAARRHAETADLFKGQAYAVARQALEDMADGNLDDPFLRSQMRRGLRDLSEMGIDTIVYHGEADAPGSPLPRVLALFLHDPHWEDGTAAVYIIGPSAPLFR